MFCPRNARAVPKKKNTFQYVKGEKNYNFKKFPEGIN